MNLNTDVTDLLWLAAGIVLAGSGVRHLLVREIYGRVHLSGEPAVLAGWSVVGIGLVELAAGIVMLVWAWRRWRG
jgi:hypothetical protein